MMRKRLAAMVMAAVLAGSSMMGCAGSGNPASTAAGEPQETAPAAAGPDGSQEADPGVKSDVTYTPVSYTHLDVYKRQFVSLLGEASS